MTRLAFVVCLFLVSAVAARADTPLDIGGRKQLFIDRRFIAASENVSLEMNQAQKLGMIQMDDGEPIYGHTSRVIEDQGKIRLYLGADGVSVLESDDAIHFRRTGTGVSKGIFTTIFMDEHGPDPEKRYKVFWIVFSNPFSLETDGVYAAYSADVDYHGGWLETPPVVFKGKRLRLNIDTGSMGTTFVELRDADGNPIPGFTLADCEEVGGNFIDQTVYWNGGHDMSALQGPPVRLYFKITRGKLFAFQFTEE